MTPEQKIQALKDNPILYIESLMNIVDKTGKLVPFKLNNEQKELALGMESKNIILKGRQVGITSYTIAYSIYLAQTQPNSTCFLIAQSLDAVNIIFNKLKMLYNNMAKPFRIPLVVNNRKELKFTNGSVITCATCGYVEIGRSATIRFAHFSEVGFCNENISNQFVSVNQAMMPNGELVAESTANGLNFFSEQYLKAEQGESNFKPFFFRWFDDKVMFKEEYEIVKNNYINKHGALPKVEELEDDERALIGLGANILQILWRRYKIRDDGLEKFSREFPCNSIQAFTTTGNNVFKAENIQSRLLNIDEDKPIPKPIRLPSTLSNWYNRGFTMWEEPDRKMKYYIGVDTSENIGQDYSVIEIINKDGEQVAEFRDNKIKVYEFAQIVYDLAMYYNKALLVIEKASSGHTVLEKIRNEYKYQNIYRHKEYDEYNKITNKIGFKTTQKSKPIIINRFVELFEQNELLIRSKSLLSEMKLFTISNGSMGAVRGNYDDCVMSFAMALEGQSQGFSYV